MWIKTPKPDRPGYYTPRNIRLSASGLALVALIVALLAGAIASGVGLYLSQESSRVLQRRLETQGVHATATVIETGTRGKKSRRAITYSYIVGMRHYHGRATLSRRELPSVDIGSRVPIRYLAGEPGASWLQGYGPSAMPLWVPLLPAIGLVALAISAIHLLYSRRRLLEEGRVAEAHVLSSKKVSGQHGSSYATELEFRVLSGATRRIKLNLRKQLSVGATTTLVYDRENPRKAAIYPFALVKLI